MSRAVLSLNTGIRLPRILQHAHIKYLAKRLVALPGFPELPATSAKLLA
jgi:hypothetical protein